MCTGVVNDNRMNRADLQITFTRDTILMRTYHIQKSCKQVEPLGHVAYIHAGCKLQTFRWD